nr:YihY/virulence factor BrkB family protein [Bacteroidota bacterium]
MLDPKNKYLAKLGKSATTFLRNGLAFSIRLLRRLILPGFDGIPLFNVLKFFVKGLFEGRLTIRASAVSFDFFLAIFPSILFFFTIIPFVPIVDFQPTLLQILQDVIPSTIWPYVSSTLEDIIIRPRSDLLSLGFILALYFSTNGINSIIEGFNSTYHEMETRSWLKQRLISLFLVILISFLIIIAITLFIVGGYVMRWLVVEGILTNSFTIIIIQIVRWILIISISLFSISFLYYFAPAKKREFRFISAGSTLATALMLLTTYGFNFYIENFSRYNALYGSIGTLLVFLLWVYFNSIILLIGFELNVSIRSARGDNRIDISNKQQGSIDES